MNEQPQQRINISSTQGCICSECSNNTFTEVFLLRKVSKFVTGGPTDSHIPISVFSCTKCNTIHQGSLPDELKALMNLPQQEIPQEEVTEKPQAKVIQMI